MLKYYILILSILISMSPIFIISADNPCDGVTVGDCFMDPNIVVDMNSYPAPLCQSLCSLIDGCTFWRHNGTNCFYLNSDYHQDCETIGGPLTVNIADCLHVDKRSCGALLEDNCSYEGRDGSLEPGQHQISNVAECQEFAVKLADFGLDITNFLFDGPDEVCELFDHNFSKSCSGIGGSSKAPSLEDCMPDTTTPPPTTITLSTVKPEPNPCDGVSLDNCFVADHHIDDINTYNPELCQETCLMIDDCTYFSHNGTHCHYLSEDYQQDCLVVGSSILADLDVCFNKEFYTCNRLLPQHCTYTDRLNDLEPTPFEIENPTDCLTYCKYNSDEIQYCVYDTTSGECQMYGSDVKDCAGIGGYQGPPSLLDCGLLY